MRQLVLLFGLLVACGDTPMGGLDSGADADLDAGAPDGGPDAGSPPSPPQPPQAPRLSDCPDGWLSRELAGTQACFAYAESATLRCPLGSIHPPGADACEAMGEPCPVDGLPTASGITQWVLAGSAGGTGSRSAPFATIAEALAVSEAGDVVGVGIGTYDEVIEIPAGVHLQGACVDGVRLTNSSGSGPVARAGRVEIRNLSVVGAEGTGLRALDTATLILESVAILEARGVGLLVSDGAQLEARDLTVSSTRVREDGTLGRGIQVQTDSSATLRRVQVASNLEYGVLVSQSTVRMEDSVIHDTGVAPADETEGQGLVALDAAQVTLMRVAIHRNHEAGIFASSSGTLVSASDLVIADVSRNRTTRAAGIAINREAVMDLERAAVLGATDYSLTATAEARLSARDVVVMGPRTGAIHNLVRGTTNAQVAIERAVLSDGGFFAMSFSEGATATLTDLVVRDVETVSVILPDDGVQGEVEIRSASALYLDLGAEVTLERGLLSGLGEVGVFVTDESSLRMVDVLVNDVARTNQQVDGIAVIYESELELERVELSNIEGESIRIQDSTIDALDLVLGVPTGSGVVGFAEGFTARDSVVRGDRWRVEGGVGFGVRFWNAQATLGSLAIHDVTLLSCPPEGCLLDSIDGFGMGFGVYAGSNVTVEHLLVEGASFCGLHMDETSSLSATAGVLARNEVGACLHGNQAQLETVVRGIEFRDNGLTVDSSVLPIPEPPSL